MEEPMKNRFVLVATPEPSTQQQLSTVLAEWGYEPVCAGSLEDALPEMAQRRFTLSLLDLGSGSGELLRRLKTQGGSPGAIVVISDADAGERALEATSLGADDFLQKPFTGKEASKTLRAILNRPLHGWKCPRCESGKYRGLSADCDGRTLTLIFACVQCELKRFSMLELAYPLERCPFCAGAVLLSGHSYIGKDEFSLGHACYFCKAVIRISTPGCRVTAG